MPKSQYDKQDSCAHGKALIVMSAPYEYRTLQKQVQLSKLLSDYITFLLV